MARYRLRYLSRAFLLLIAGLLSLAGVVFVPSSERVIDIPVAGFQPGTVRLIQGLWVARQPDGEFFVFLNRDPHLLHPTQWVEPRHLFISPAHGEVYGIDGVCRAGPCNARPPGSLYRVASKLDGDRLAIYPERPISGGIHPKPIDRYTISGAASTVPSTPVPARERAVSVPSPPPLPPAGATPTKRVVPPGSVAPPGLIVHPPEIAGKIVHWSQSSYMFRTGIRDSANGRILTLDIWERIGDDGLPIAFQAVSTLPNGTFHQANIRVPGAYATIWGPNDPMVTRSSGCAGVVTQTHDDSRPLGAPPRFVDETVVKALGYHREGGLTTELPVTPVLDGVQPSLRYGPEDTARRWVKVESADGITTWEAVEIGTHGRVLASKLRRVDAISGTVDEHWTVYGPVDVYDPALVPASVFALTQHILEHCRQ
ncbi:hypothetical protein [Nitrolancea hollandica]|uniref:Rieske domain-containing protein n=1 Tax=Nitrolancea hollandica Lb TaxID=1129897 RepID=I4EK59_9BACT|nr:hypothetical protein [Nitrolancea hollandica]CCF85071.1 exported hypothetical protein [Nitrolancea hollandica Lb]